MKILRIMVRCTLIPGQLQASPTRATDPFGSPFNIFPFRAPATAAQDSFSFFISDLYLAGNYVVH